MMESGLEQCGIEVEPQPQPPNLDRPAQTAWIAIGLVLVVILAVDVALAVMGKHTLSTVAQHWFQHHLLLKVIAFVGIVLVGFHLTFSFPW